MAFQAVSSLQRAAWMTPVLTCSDRERRGLPFTMVFFTWPKATSTRAKPSLHVIATTTLMLLIVICITVCITMQERPSSVSEEEKTLLNRRTIFIAANYYNNESILREHLPQVLRLIGLIRAAGGDAFISVYENGSKDKTPAILDEFRYTCRQQNIMHRIISERTPSWRHLHPENNVEERIKYMAKIRNLVLEPLSADRFDDVIFFNDVIFNAEDVIRLLVTKQLRYDAVCAMDFNRVTFYDTWVSRDINGFAMAPYYPYVHDEESASLLKQNKPFPVTSCWNGIVVIKAAALAGIKFRSWRVDEPRSSHLLDKLVYNSECPISECALLFKDLVQHGYSGFYINPSVHVTYTHTDWFLHWIFGGLLNLLSRLFLVIDRQPRVSDLDRISSCDVMGEVRYRFWPNFIMITLFIFVVIALTYFHQRDARRIPFRPKGLPKYLV